MKRENKYKGWDGSKMLPTQDLSQNSEFWTWLGKNDVTLLQYTGLKDKNGVEIYVGDIIQIRSPYRNYQTHYGENIPRPEGRYTEPLEPEIKTKSHVIDHVNGMFYMKNEKDYDQYQPPLAWDLIEYKTRDDLVDAFCSRENEWIDKNGPKDCDLGYLLSIYPPNTEKELMEYLSGCLVIGNIYENPELLKKGSNYE